MRKIPSFNEHRTFDTSYFRKEMVEEIQNADMKKGKRFQFQLRCHVSMNESQCLIRILGCWFTKCVSSICEQRNISTLKYFYKSSFLFFENLYEWYHFQCCFLGHLSHSGDLLLWVGVRRRASSINIFFSRTIGPI